MKRARSYAEERSSSTTSANSLDYLIYRSKNHPEIIRAPTKSAHIGRKIYNPTIRFDRETVLDWWCDCPSGSRYVGCCSHVASMIWFLSFQRWQSQSYRIGSREFIKFFTDASVLCEPMELSTDSDDDTNDDDDEDEDTDDDDDEQ